MRWSEIGDMTCSIARALSVVGDRWTLLILRDAFLRTRRFEQFQASLKITRHRLADRLQKLVDNGILERLPYQDNPPRFEYKLTAKGVDLYPVIAALVGWGDRWMAGKDGVPIELVHRGCGHTIAPEFVCPDCREPIGARDMLAQPGPGLLAQRKKRRSAVKRKT
ncbi:MAG: helix-turn-helix transcriptional regulator [Deltaproteobacteria bacterium]|nr:helix-turn-helix transcriptional regulator [Deltaproteobacteria bacterium]